MDDADGSATWPSERRLVAGQFGYHFGLMLRSPRAVFAGVLLPAIILAMRGRSGGPHADMVAGLAVLGAVSAAYATHAMSLVLARESGVLGRWRMSPLPPWCFFAGKTLATLVLAGGCALATVAVADLMGVSFAPARIAVMLAPILVGVLCWATIATAVSSLIPAGDAAYPLLTITYLPVVLLSGAAGGKTDQPEWIHRVVELMPVRPVLLSAAHALETGHPDVSVRGVAVLAAWTALSAGVVGSHFRWTPRPTQRRRERFRRVSASR